MTACRPGWTAGRERWRRPAATQDYTNFINLAICVILILTIYVPLIQKGKEIIFYAGKTDNRIS
jgi:hypothetical protein